MQDDTQDARSRLQFFFREHPKVCIALSGGVDSSCLLCAAVHAGASVQALFACTEFTKPSAQQNAERAAAFCGLTLRTVSLSMLEDQEIAANSERRCYLCKKRLFTALKAASDGSGLLCDGSNAADDPRERPGMQALDELHICSPLRIAGIDKATVRRLAAGFGLFNAALPSDSCLATRIACGQCLTEGDLRRVGQAEDFLRDLGIDNLRVRVRDTAARIVVPSESFSTVVSCRMNILSHLRGLGFTAVYLDLSDREHEKS